MNNKSILPLFFSHHILLINYFPPFSKLFYNALLGDPWTKDEIQAKIKNKNCTSMTAHDNIIHGSQISQ